MGKKNGKGDGKSGTGLGTAKKVKLEKRPLNVSEVVIKEPSFWQGKNKSRPPKFLETERSFWQDS